MRKAHVLVLAALLAASLSTTARAQRIIYVDDSATGTADGTSWDTAWRRIQDAINSARADQVPPDEIWVAAGTYKADYSYNDWVAISLKSGVAVYGGFVGAVGTGNERNVRNLDPQTNGTVISGDLGGGLHSLTIITADALSQRSRFDGFAITGAVETAVVVTGESYITLQNLYIHDNVNNGSDDSPVAGLSVIGSSQPIIRNCVFSNNLAYGGSCGAAATTDTDESLPRFYDCTFQDNWAEYGYSAAYLGLSSFGAHFERCVFDGNESSGPGGAIRQSATSSSHRLEIRECVFSENVGVNGGAVYVEAGATPTWVVACEFTGNAAATGYGGAICCTGGAAGVSLLDVVNCRFTANTATYQGGAIYRYRRTLKATNCLFLENESGYGDGVGSGGAIHADGADCQLINCTIASNYSNSDLGEFGGGVSFGTITIPTNPPQTYGSVNAVNCIFWDNASHDDRSEQSQIYPVGQYTTVTHSCIMGLDALASSTGNIRYNPLWVTPPGQTPGVPADLHLSPTSPCLNAGSNEAVEADSKDADGDGNVLEPTPAVSRPSRKRRCLMMLR